MGLPDIATRCADTPDMVVFDARGLLLREVQFNRADENSELDSRVTRYRYGRRGEQISCSDPRLSSASLGGEYFNMEQESDLLNRGMWQRGADSGEKLILSDPQGQPRWQWSGGAAGVQQRYQYDKARRPQALYSQRAGETAYLQQRWQYGEELEQAETGNRRGQCVLWQDGGGEQRFDGYSLRGECQQQQRRFLADRELSRADWLTPPALEAEQWQTVSRYGASGELREQVLYRLAGEQRQPIYQHVQRYNRQGQLNQSELHYGENTQRVLQQADYNALGACVREVLGNDTERLYSVEATTQYLVNLTTYRPVTGGGVEKMQDIAYQYDPVGNLLSSEASQQDTRYFANRRVSSQRRQRYDACYQLTYSSGRELAGQNSGDVALPLVNDPTLFTPYERWYHYDRGGNLQWQRHEGQQGCRRWEYVTARYSNRTLMPAAGQEIPPEEVDSYFDTQGNLRVLSGGQTLAWNEQQCLQRVEGVRHTDGSVDDECYQYDGNGLRCSKRSNRLANSERQGWRHETVSYLPGLRLCRRDYNGRQQQQQYVLNLGLAGYSSVSCVIDDQEPAGVLRYACQDRQNSASLELDINGKIITQEEYYAYGATALFTARSEAEAESKYYRYSGKERDNLGGLYDYGLRYYAPWLCRWISADPLGAADGLNLYCMVRNNPVTLTDNQGLMSDIPYCSLNGESRGIASRLSSVVQRGGRFLQSVGSALKRGWGHVRNAFGQLQQYIKNFNKGYHPMREEGEHIEIFDISRIARMTLSGVTETASSDNPHLPDFEDDMDNISLNHEYDWDDSADNLPPAYEPPPSYASLQPGAEQTNRTGERNNEATITLNQRDFSLNLGDLPELLREYEELGTMLNSAIALSDIRDHRRDGGTFSVPTRSNYSVSSDNMPGRLMRQPLAFWGLLWFGFLLQQRRRNAYITVNY
jgi:insecticidal toxin complex protein TccC